MTRFRFSKRDMVGCDFGLQRYHVFSLLSHLMNVTSCSYDYGLNFVSSLSLDAISQQRGLGELRMFMLIVSN